MEVYYHPDLINAAIRHEDIKINIDIVIFCKTALKLCIVKTSYFVLLRILHYCVNSAVLCFNVKFCLIMYLMFQQKCVYEFMEVHYSCTISTLLHIYLINCEGKN